MESLMDKHELGAVRIRRMVLQDQPCGNEVPKEILLHKNKDSTCYAFRRSTSDPWKSFQNGKFVGSLEVASAWSAKSQNFYPPIGDVRDIPSRNLTAALAEIARLQRDQWPLMQDGTGAIVVNYGWYDL